MIKNLKPKLAEAGKIKIGGLGAEKRSARGGTYRVPQKYDHFVVTGTQRDAAGNLVVDNAIMDKLESDADGQVRAIPIVLHSDDIDGVFPTSYALYSGKKCACRGDGETAVRREIKDKEFTGAEKQVTCPCDYLGAEKGPRCKPNGKLYCSISLEGSAVAGAVHIWRTASIISVRQMIASLEQIKSICGTLRGVPLWLLVRPVTVEPKGSGPITVFCCHVELRAADVEEVQRRALERAKIRRLLGGNDAEYRQLLTAPGVGESREEQAAIEVEFYGEAAPDYDTETGEVATPARVVDPKAPADSGDVRAAIEARSIEDGVREYVDDEDERFDEERDLFGGLDR